MRESGAVGLSSEPGNETTEAGSSCGASGLLRTLLARSRRMSDLVIRRGACGRDVAIDGRLASVSCDERDDMETVERGRLALLAARTAARRLELLVPLESVGSESVREMPRRSAADAEWRRARGGPAVLASSCGKIGDRAFADAGPTEVSRSRPHAHQVASSLGAGESARSLGAGESGLPAQRPQPSEYVRVNEWVEPSLSLRRISDDAGVVTAGPIWRALD